MTLLTLAPLKLNWSKENECRQVKRIHSRLECRYGPKNVNLAFKAIQATLTTLLVVLKGTKSYQTDKAWRSRSTSTSLLLCKIWYICLCAFYSMTPSFLRQNWLLCFVLSVVFFSLWTLDQWRGFKQRCNASLREALKEVNLWPVWEAGLGLNT